MGTERTPRRERRHWLEIDEAPQLVSAASTMKKKVMAAGGKRWSPAINTVLIAFVMTMPPLVILLGGRIGEPVVWIKTAVAGIRQGN